MKNKSIRKKILIALSAVGPGLFLIGYNIGTGSVTTMAKTGAEHGMVLGTYTFVYFYLHSNGGLW